MPAAKGLLIVPAFNEARTIAEVLRAVALASTGLEVVVVDDGSRDETADLALDHRATLIRHPFNLGYGAALQTGYKYALVSGAPFLVQMDADGQHDARQIPELLGPILADECDLVIGSRFLDESGYSMGRARSTGRMLLRGLARLTGLSVSDPTSGFQAMNRKVLEIYARDFFPTDYPDVDVLLAAHRGGLRIGERGVAMAKSSRPSTLHGGLRSVYYMYKMLLSIYGASTRRPSPPRTRAEKP